MNTLILGMPRTRTSYVAKLIADGGARMMFEPFHDALEVRQKYAKQAPIEVWDPSQSRYDWVRANSSRKDNVLKSLAPQNRLECNNMIIAEWADQVIIMQRNLLDTVCSFVIAYRRGNWFSTDKDESVVIVKRREIVWVIKVLKERWLPQRRAAASIAGAMGIPLCMIGDNTPSEAIPTLLNCCGIKTAVKDNGMTVTRCRSAPPRDMIENISEVKRWLKNMAPGAIA